MPDLADIDSSRSSLDRRAASRDLWPGGTLAAWQGEPAPTPDQVFWPVTETEVERILAAATARGIAVVPYGAGSGVCGGARGRAGSWVIDTKRIAHIGPLDPEGWTVRVGAGVIGQQLEDWLAARGYTLGHSPSSISCSTVGGWAAARSAGQFSSKYGVFEDMVSSIRGVAPGVGAFRVGEGGSHPAAWLDQILGSEGTLAILTEVTVRIWPAPAHRWLRGYRFEHLPDALAAMRRLMQEELHPSVVRLYDPVDTKIGGKTRPPRGDASSRRWLQGALARVDALPGVRQRTLALPLSLPGAVNRILGRMARGCLVVAGWEGPEDLVAMASDEGHRILTRDGEDLGSGPGERWFASRHAVSYKLMPVFERGGFVDTMEVAARWSDLEGIYRAVRGALSRTAVVMAHMSHVYPEGGCIYFSFAGAGDQARYQHTWDLAQEAVLDWGGTLSHHHGIGSLKAAGAAREIGPAVAGWRSLKATMDPAGILNPGRLFVDVPHEEPGPPAPVRPEDGLGRGAPSASLVERRGIGEPMWPWTRLPGLPRWQRLPWQTAWIEISGEIDGQRCLLGRGPRSAVGPDLRPWLVAHGEGVQVTWALAPDGPRWMGEATVEDPWRVARDLLRGDLRPAVLTVVEGRLRVGFRGVAAERWGRLASTRVPGGLEEVPYAQHPFPSGPLDACDLDDPGVVWVTPQGAFRPRGDP